MILGSWPFQIPGIPAPVKLGLAGGPLVVAIVLSRIGHIGPFVWYMNSSANYVMREIGIVLFLACVGLRSGDKFLANLQTGGVAMNESGGVSDGDVINLFNPPSCAPDFTKNLNVTAIVLNVPIASLQASGETVFDTWSTISVPE